MWSEFNSDRYSIWWDPWKSTLIVITHNIWRNLCKKSMAGRKTYSVVWPYLKQVLFLLWLPRYLLPRSRDIYLYREMYRIILNTPSQWLGAALSGWCFSACRFFLLAEIKWLLQFSTLYIHVSVVFLPIFRYLIDSI